MKFNYTTKEELINKIDELNLKNLPLSDDVSILKDEVKVGDVTIPNRIVIQPMEGCDGTPSGEPDELTLRRYDRFAASGAGLVWAEAVAVVEEGRANPRQHSRADILNLPVFLHRLLRITTRFLRAIILLINRELLPMTNFLNWKSNTEKRQNWQKRLGLTVLILNAVTDILIPNYCLPLIERADTAAL